MSIPLRQHLQDLPRTGRPLALAAGFFDGVHRGHRRVIETAVGRIRARGGSCWVLSFEDHPRKLIRPGVAPLMLTSTPHKLRLFEALGADGCLLLPFTPELAALPAARFLERLRRQVPDWSLISVGADWRFGRGGEGDTALLAEFGRTHGIDVVAVPPVLAGGAPVSSTRIREAVRAGLTATAASLLGRPFSVLGKVVKGGGLARTFGFPTANLEPQNEVKPAEGVYACWARLPDGALKPAVANVGRRPTLQPVMEPVMEVHLIGCDLRLYGRTIDVYFIRRLRGERRFPSVTALAAQVRRDVAAARKALSGKSKKACEECFTNGRHVRYSGGPKTKTVIKVRGQSVHG